MACLGLQKLYDPKDAVDTTDFNYDASKVRRGALDIRNVILTYGYNLRCQLDDCDDAAGDAERIHNLDGRG